jgi:hypothetical protein
MMKLPEMPQLHLESIGEYEETYINPNPEPNRLEGDRPFPLDMTDGTFVNLFAIAKLVVCYADRMPARPEFAAKYTLDFGKNKPDAMRVYTMIFSDGQKRKIPGYPAILISQCLEKIFLDAIRDS